MTANDAFKKRLKRREDMFLRRLFGILAKMAKADGKVDAWEVHAAEGAFARFPRAAARRAFCKGVFNSSKDGRSSVCRLAEEFASSWARPDDCFAVYELLWDIACAKGVLNPAHKEILRTVCVSLKLPEPYFGIFYRKRRSTFREITPEEASGANGRQGRTAGGSKNARESSNRRRRPSPPPPRQKTPLEIPSGHAPRVFRVGGADQEGHRDDGENQFRLGFDQGISRVVGGGRVQFFIAKRQNEGQGAT